MKIKEPITMAYYAIFKPKKHKELTAMLKLGWSFNLALRRFDANEANRIDEFSIKTIDRLSEIADIIIDSNKKKKI